MPSFRPKCLILSLTVSQFDPTQMFITNLCRHRVHNNHTRLRRNKFHPCHLTIYTNPPACSGIAHGDAGNTPNSTQRRSNDKKKSELVRKIAPYRALVLAVFRFCCEPKIASLIVKPVVVYMVTVSRNESHQPSMFNSTAHQMKKI